MTLAFCFCIAAASSWADAPEAALPPSLPIYALAPDSASAPDPVPAASEPATTSSDPEVAAPDPSAPSASEAPSETDGETAGPLDPPAAEAATLENREPAAAAKPSALDDRKTPAPAAKNGRIAASAPKKSSSRSGVRPLQGPLHPGDEAARSRAEVERTDPILRSVRVKVVRSFNKKAREQFGIATSRQREAREALDGSLYARAERLTLEARRLAREIAVHLGPPQDDPDYVAMTLDRTDDALKRAHEVLRDTGGSPEWRRLAALESRQKEARGFHKDGKTRKAYASTRDVRDGVLTLLRDCDDLPVPEVTAERALKHASRSLDQAKGELGERLNTAAARLAREARAQMEKAKAAFARKNYRDTLLHSKLVERNLELAVSAQRSATSRNG